MAAVTPAVSAADTTDNSPLTSGSLTPAAGDLLVLFGCYTNSFFNATVTDTQNLGWTAIQNAYKLSTDFFQVFIANTLAANTAMTITVTPGNEPTTASGVAFSVFRVSGMTLTGLAACRQVAGFADMAGGNSPSGAFQFGNVLTGSPTIGCVFNGANPSGLVAPAGWTEGHNIGYDTPATGMQSVYRDSGFTGTAITWGSASASDWAIILLELDASGLPIAKSFLEYTAPPRTFNFTAPERKLQYTAPPR